MKPKIFLVLISFFAGCTSAKKEVTTAPVENLLTLEQAFLQPTEQTVEYLKSRMTAKAFEGAHSNDPIKNFPPELLRERHSSSVTEDKKNLRAALRKYRPWKLSRKLVESEVLLSASSCESVIPTQALAFLMEVDFPEDVAIEAALKLHEKVLSCPEFAGHESRFRLSAFLIQKGNCEKALQYLKQVSAGAEQGLVDRASYMSSLCGEKQITEKVNPLGGYGVLVSGPEVHYNEKAVWQLSTQSGSENWDRVLATLVELVEKDKRSSFNHVISRVNIEQFKALPLTFKTSVWYLMNISGADLGVFQTLHPYLSENPNMISAVSLHLLFPVRYWQEITEAAKDVDPILVKSLIRQESAFNPQAKSPAKAMGLMQLLYSTARIFGISKRVELSKPEANLKAGSKFLASLIEDFGNPELALAAYNAGPGMVRQWQKRYPTDNLNLFVEMIPYSETREYVRLVNRNYQIYQSLLIKPQILGKSH